MNQDNVNYLKKELTRFGFGDRLNEGLEKSMTDLPEKFQLSYKTEFNAGTESKNMEYMLDFKKSAKSDMYFFNSYKATLVSEFPEENKSQKFYTKDSVITTEQAFNLLDGRAIRNDFKGLEDNVYNAWRQLDFGQQDKYENYKVNTYHEKYGFNLDASLAKLPIPEAAGVESRDALIASLEKGNLQKVTFELDGKEQAMYVAANPKFKSVDVYDSNMKSVYQGNEKEKSNDTDTKSAKTESKSQAQEKTEPAGRTKRKGVKI